MRVQPIAVADADWIPALAAAPHEADLRQFLASLTRLNLLADDSARLPGSQEEHDAVILEFPRFRCSIDLPDYRGPDGTWFGCDFNVRSFLSRLAVDAAAAGQELSYHANLEPLEVAPEWQGEVAKNAVHVGLLRGAPLALRESQQRVARQVRHARYLGEEILGVATMEAVEWLQAYLAEEFTGRFGEAKLGMPDFVFDQESYDLSLIGTRQPAAFEEPSPALLCAACLSDDEMVDLLSWPVPAELGRRLRPAAPRRAEPGDTAERETLLPAEGLPKLHSGHGDYIFISYKREDLPRLLPVMQQLVAWGFNIWYDKGIVGGAEWDAVLEERLKSCRLLLLFMSDAAIRSKYVRREVKYADCLDKPLLTVRLEAAELTDGMDMLLGRYQMLDAAAGDFLGELRRSVSR